MKKVLYAIILFSAALSSRAMAQEGSIFPKGEKAPANHFTGTVWVQIMVNADDQLDCVIGNVTFEPGARTNWHSHPGGQILLVTDGRGYYQEKGKSIQLIQKGDVIKCTPEVAHWHGATPDSTLTHISTVPDIEKGETKWLERVTDEVFNSINAPAATSKDVEQEIIDLSKKKWQWMSEKNVDTLAALFHEKAEFVHMGGSWGKDQELNIIKTGGIHYKKADIHEVLVNVIGNTAILLNRITMLAVVGGNEVTNPFMVTEVYIKGNGTWMLGSLSFTRLLTPNDTQH